MSFYTQGTIWDIQFKTTACQKLSDVELLQCKALFDEHYGKWGEGSPKRGERIRFPKSLYEKYRHMDNAYVALATHDGNVIGQAFYLKTEVRDTKKIAWVLQLVVHEDYRQRGIAKTLLYSIWGFTDDYAWGLATSNALTVKTLEKATFRKVDLSEMQKHKDEIIMIKNKIPFAQQSEVRINEKESVLNSGFPVDRLIVEKNLKLYDGTWELGDLPQGHEWLAFTFQSQNYQMTQDEYSELFEHSEKIVNDAYNRMNFTKQPWNRHQAREAAFILEQLKTKNIATVMDFGCGNGRHTLEFASNGYHCIGIDYSPKKISEAREKSASWNTCFAEGDCRNIELSEKADLALCLYDVVGSFVKEEDNRAIVRNIYRHLNRGAVLVLSVMNLELTEAIAIHKVPIVSEHLNELARLKPSRIMQNSGNIFDPEYFLLETSTGVVYRKEQFENEDELSAEYVIRDKRYRCNEICELLESEGFRVYDKRYVQAGKWEAALQPQDKAAKEILLFAEKSS